MAHDGKPFWMVSTRRGWAPRFRHPTLEAATTEAQRLAEANPGRRYHVLEAVTSVKINPEPAAAVADEAKVDE